MRIALFTTSFPRADDDLAGSFVLGFARALAARGHTLHVLAPEPPRGSDPPAWPAISVTWLPYLRPRTFARTFYGAGVLDNLRRDPAAWPGLATFPIALATAARTHARAADALVSHWALPCALAAASVADARPHLAVLHSADVHLLERLPARTLLSARIAHGATAIQCVSTSLRDRFLALLPPVLRAPTAHKIRVLPMGVDAPPPPSPERRAHLRRRFGFTRFTALFLGRLVPIKGVDLAIRAVAHAATGVDLIIAGDGPERPRLERLAHALDAPVRFVGPVHGDTKWALLHAADAFVAPSHARRRTEGTPVAALEAMAAGLPVIATPSGGLADVVRAGETGLRIAPDRPADLSRALTELCTRPDLHARLQRGALAEGDLHRWPRRAGALEALLAAPPDPNGARLSRVRAASPAAARNGTWTPGCPG